MEIKDILWTLGLSIVPISEIRGAIIYCFTNGISGFSLAFMYFLAVFGNFLPVPFVILLFRPLLKFFKKVPGIRKICIWLEERTHRKAGKMSNLGAIALYTFVAIPLPTTGAWTGAMIAGLFGMRLRKALPAILLGVMTAGIIMMILCKIGAESLGFLGFLVES